VASDILGVSGRAMLEALIVGDDDPAALADLAKRRLRSKIPELTEALTGRFSEHHAFLARVHLDLIDRHTAAIDKLTARIEVMMEPFQGFRDLICTIPGISTLTADVVIAETGADMSRFPTAKHLASWAGTTPGHNESAGKVKSSKTRPGSPYLQGALGAAAMGLLTEHAHLPGRPLPPDCLPPRTAEGQRRDPTLDVDRDLTHGHYRHPLRRPRNRPLHPTPPRPSQEASPPSTPGHGLPSHPRQRQLNETCSDTKE
jgi:transposase